MKLRSRRGRAAAGDGGDEQEEPALKRPAVFEDFEKTVQKTRKGVDKSQRVQKSVKKQVAVLRAMRDELKTINNQLVEQLATTGNSLEQRNQLVNQLQLEMAKLQRQQEVEESQIERVREYESRVTAELRQQINLLEKLNSDMNQVSDEYLDLFEDDESRKGVYLDYYDSLLRESGFNKDEIEVVITRFSTAEITVADIKQRVDSLEELLESQQPSEFIFELKQDLLPTEQPEQQLKKKKTTKK